MVRECLALMPGAIVISDADTTEVLGFSPSALALFRGTADGFYRAIDFHVDASEWEEGLRHLELSPGSVVSRATRMQDTQGNQFPALLRFMLTEMAGRRVFISTIERGLPDPTDDTFSLA